MPRGRSTFIKHQKELMRQQRQRDKTARRSERKQGKSEPGSVPELDDLRQNAAAQAAMFQMDRDQSAHLEQPQSTEKTIE
jgi:hypothetical protein